MHTASEVSSESPVFRRSEGFGPKIARERTGAMVFVMCFPAQRTLSRVFRTGRRINNVTRVSLASGAPGVSGKQPIELVCEHLAFALAQRGGAAGVDAAASQLIQEITH